MKDMTILLMPTIEIDRRFCAPAHDIDYVLDRRDALSVLLKTLPPSEATAVRLFYFSDESAAVVAERLGATPLRTREVLADAEAMMQGLARTCFRHLCTNGGGG